MSNVGSTLQSEDWWVMNADGSAKTRLSHFDEPSSHFNGGQLVTCGPIAASNWIGEGSVFSADVQTNLLSADGEILRVEMTCP